MRNSFAALPMTFQKSCSTMQFKAPPYLRWWRGHGQNVSAHHSRVDHDVAMAHRALLPAARHTQRPLRLPPGRREKGRAAGAALLGKGAGPRGKALRAAGQRPIGHRHSPLDGIGLLSVLGAAGQEAGLAGEAVGHIGGHGQLGRPDGHHGGLRAAAPAPCGAGAPEGAVTASVSRATRGACAGRRPRAVRGSWNGSGWGAL